MNDNDALGRLLRAAGLRPRVPDERARRAREVAREEWSAVVANRAARDRRAAVRRLVVVAAAVVIAALGIWIVRDRASQRGAAVTPDFAAVVVERVVGEVSAAPRGAVAVPLPLVEGSRLEEPGEVVTSGSSRVGLRLVSGHSVRLDESTRVEWLADRRLRLRSGAIYVDADGADEAVDAPLVVETAWGSIVELGTRYEVRVDADALTVRLRHGAVRWTPSTDVAAEPRVVRAGRGIVVSGAGAVEEREVGPTSPAWDWVSAAAPPFVLDDATLAEFLDRLRREHGFSFRYEDPAMWDEASSIRLSGGSIEALRPDEALRVVLATCGWRTEPLESDGVYELDRD